MGTFGKSDRFRTAKKGTLSGPLSHGSILYIKRHHKITPPFWFGIFTSRQHALMNIGLGGCGCYLSKLKLWQILLFCNWAFCVLYELQRWCARTISPFKRKGGNLCKCKVWNAHPSTKVNAKIRLRFYTWVSECYVLMDYKFGTYLKLNDLCNSDACHNWT